MYVCLCNGYTDRQLRDAARNGASSVAKAYRRLGRAAQCGRCVGHARDLIERVRIESEIEPAALIAAE